MKKVKKGLWKAAVFKWVSIFALVFVLSLPVTGQLCLASDSLWTVKVDTGYLALRNDQNYDASNEIGELYSGDVVEVIEQGNSSYWYVYAPALDKCGYVNKKYLVSYEPTWTVKVDKGYLALRSTKGYFSSNEIARLYTGDAVQVKDDSDDTYWYVYVPKLDMFGYVNQQYLYVESSESRTVTVTKGYLALRNAKGFDASNEIGELYTGDTVQILDSSDPIYWYVYSPEYDKNGYVDKNYLSGGSSGDNSYPIMNVSVKKGYLALRSAKYYDTSNEIGQLYTGDAVQVRDKSDASYWYVYSPQLGKYGYVNKDYLR